jgi:hypothetical protein
MKNDLTQEEYLYGVGVDVPSIPEAIILKRIELLDKHIGSIFEVPFMERDNERLNAVIKAKNFWLKINEVEH